MTRWAVCTGSTLIVVLLLVVSSLVGGCSRQGAIKHSYNIESLKTEGDRILAALRTYKADHGQYPRSLQEIPETYLSPPPIRGTANGGWEWLTALLKERGELGLTFRLYETKTEIRSLVYTESKGWCERTHRKQSI
jgi:hypothetical protein